MLRLIRRYTYIIIGFSALLYSGCSNETPTAPPLGPEWIVYTHDNSRLAGNRIRCIHIDSDGSLWFGTDSGASRFTPRTNSWTNLKDSLRTSGGSIAQVSAITQAKDRSVWFGTIGAGVIRFNSQSQTGRAWTRFIDRGDGPTVVTGITAYKLDPGGYGEIWVASNSGIDRYDQTDVDQGTWTYYDPSITVSLPTRNIVSAFTNPIDDHLWFGAATGGAVEAYYDANLLWDKFESPLEKYQVNTIAFDVVNFETNNVWFGKEVGASKLNLMSGKWTYYTPDSTNGQFPGGAVNAIETNYLTTRWFGMDSGLVLLDDTVYSRFTQDNSQLPNNRVTALKLDMRGNLWIGTRFGLAVYKKGGTQF